MNANDRKAVRRMRRNYPSLTADMSDAEIVEQLGHTVAFAGARISVAMSELQASIAEMGRDFQKAIRR